MNYSIPVTTFSPVKSRKARFNSITCNSDSSDSGVPDPDSSRTSNRIVKALEVSFAKVWVSLGLHGVGEEYSNAIRAFILATIAAYESGYSLSQLKLELQVNSEFITQAQKLGLTDEQIQSFSMSSADKQTRDYWLLLVYLTLHYLRHSPPYPVPPAPADELRVSSLVEFVCEQRKRGFSLDGMKLEARLKQDGSKNTALESEEEQRRSRAAAAVRSQWMRIVYITAEEASKK